MRAIIVVASETSGAEVTLPLPASHPIVAIAGRGCGQIPAFSGVCRHRRRPDLPGIMPWRVPLVLAAPLGRVFNDYDFGGYLIANGVAPFIDGRTELYGEKFFVDHNAASGLIEPENLFQLLWEYKVEATLMPAQSPATQLIDHMHGWTKVDAQDEARC